jgi:hypothetical protein
LALSRPRHTVRARATGLVAGLVLLSVLSCSKGDEDVVHDDGDGILSASSASGGKGLSRPSGLSRDQPWKGSFGGLLLCLTDEGSGPARIEKVRYEFKVPPRSRRTWVRVVPERSEQHPGESFEWAPFYGLLGAPGAFRLGTIRGDFTPFKRGLEITDSCSDGSVAFTELVTVLEAGPGGAWSRGVLIDYTADGQDHTLRVPWEMVTCGTRTVEYCRPAGPSG